VIPLRRCCRQDKRSLTRSSTAVFCDRLERITRPTKAFELNTSSLKSGAADGTNDEFTLEDAAEGGGSPAASSEAVLTSVAKPTVPVVAARAAVPLKARPNVTVSTDSLPEPTTSTTSTASAGTLPAGIVALKRSVSPSTASQSSRDGHLVGLGTIPLGASATASGGTQSPLPRSEVNVRGSLTLLKTKAASSRRRRSVADIEGAQNVAAGDANEDTVAGGVGNSTDQPLTRREIFPEDRTPVTPAAASVARRPTQSSASQPSQPQQQPQGVPPARVPPRVALDLTGFQADDDDADPDYNHGNEDDMGPPADGGPKVPCAHCGRTFNPQSYQRHAKICEKVFIRKRKTFDSAKMRIEGNPDLKEFVDHGGADVPNARAGSKKGAKPALERKLSSKEHAATTTAATPGAKWRHQSDAFRAALRSARETTEAVASGAPLPPPIASAPDPSMKQCPHCSRRFNANAAERHIPVCQGIRAKPAALRRGGGGNASNGAGGMASTSGKVVNRGWQ
jgi:hypothetical protein